jgi:membrane-associated protease RseP (regulator of RpoE activity)
MSVASGAESEQMVLTDQILRILQIGWWFIEVVVIFGVLVIVHEFGHFVTAKLFGMRVDEFAIGFGKRLFAWQKGETVYSVNVVPLGGYNKIYGMDLQDEEESPQTGGSAKPDKPVAGKSAKAVISPEALSPDYSIAPRDDPRAFVNRPVYQRFVVGVSGSLANLLIAIFVVFAMGISLGFTAAELGGVIPEGPAADAGLRPGDIITYLDGARISSTADLQRAVAFSDGKPLHLIGIRDNRRFSVTVNPQPIRLVDSSFCRLGFIYLNDGTIVYSLPGTPAARADLEPGDIILSADGIKFRFNKLDMSGGNGIATFEIYRGFYSLAVKVDYFDNELIRDSYSPFGFFLNQDQVLTAVVPNDIAAKAGLQAGDKIIASSLETWVSSDLGESAGDTKPLNITYVRNGATHHVRLKPDELFSRIQVYMDDASVPVLAGLPHDHPLYLAGLRSGDRILSVAGAPTPNGISVWLQFERMLGRSVSVVSMSGDSERVFNVGLPGEKDAEQAGKFLGGLRFKTRYFWTDPLTSFAAGVRKCGDIVVLIFRTLQYLVTGRVSVNDLAGPVGIASVTYEAAKSGFVDLVNIMVLLSINLGIFNLLPFPGLDGGRLLFMIAEGILRRPVVNVRVENIIHFAGLFLLILFLLFVSYHDILRNFLPH